MTPVVTIDPAADPRWDRFVERHPSGSAYHLGDWARILGGAYGFKPRCLALEAGDGELAGVLPMMSSFGIATRRRLRSLPIVPPVDPLAGSDTDVTALIEAACDHADERGASWVIRTRGAHYAELAPRITRAPARHPAWIMRLPRDPDELMSSWKRRSNNLYRNVRKTFTNGITVRDATSDRDLRRVYRLYATTIRGHAALPRSYRQFLLDWRLFAPRGICKVLVAEHEGRLVAGAVFHGFGAAADLLYNGSDPASLHLRPNHALYWRAINWAVETGRAEFDFGIAKVGSSLAAFKAQWGAEPVPEFRYDYPPRATRADSLRRSSEGARRGRMLRAAWRRAPLPLMRIAGTLVYRYL